MGLDNVKLHVVDSFEAAHACFNWATKQERLAVDTETTGYLPDRDHVRLVQFGGEDEGWAIPVEGIDSYAALVHEILRSHKGGWDGHNLKFDKAMVRKMFGYDISLHRADDTMIMHHVLNPHLSSALKNVGDRLIDPFASAGSYILDETMKKNGWTWATIPVLNPQYTAYGALDTVLTARLRKELYTKVTTKASAAYDLELATSFLVEKVERRGARIHRDYAEDNLTKFQHRMEQIESNLRSEYQVKPGSTAGIIQVLMKHGFTFDEKTESGAVSLDKNVLGGIDHPLAHDVLEYRQLQKLGSTYLKNFLSMTSVDDDLIHPSINSLGFSEKKPSGFGVKTSRMSMSDPNLQNLPRAGTSAAGDVIRTCIIPRGGHTLIFCDLSQIESRIIAHFSKDERLMRAFDEGDFFVNMLRTMYNEPDIQRKDPRRSPMKNTWYGKAYGAQPARLASTMGVPLSTANEFFNLINKTYPGINKYATKLENEGKVNQRKHGLTFVTNERTGRPYVVDQGDEYVLFNRMVQGTASELFKILILRLAAAGLDEFMILFVHDEVILDVPNDLVTDVAYILKEVMNCTDLISLPVTADVSFGDSWGRKKEYVFK